MALPRGSRGWVPVLDGPVTRVNTHLTSVAHHAGPGRLLSKAGGHRDLAV